MVIIVTVATLSPCIFGQGVVILSLLFIAVGGMHCQCCLCGFPVIHTFFRLTKMGLW